MKPFKLTKKETEEADNAFTGVRSLMDEMNRVKQFKVGDYLVAKQFNPFDGTIGSIITSRSYKTPEKFVVVYLSKDGIPFYKRMDARNIPMGKLYCCMHSQLETATRDVKWKGSPYYMELDPDYADAIILDSKDTFNASLQKQVKADLYKEITEHNKANKIPTHDHAEFEKFLKTVKVGDSLWASGKTQFIVTSVEKLTRAAGERKHGYVVSNDEVHSSHYKYTFVYATSPKGMSVVFSAIIWKVQCSNLYKLRPRSYSELKNQ